MTSETDGLRAASRDLAARQMRPWIRFFALALLVLGIGVVLGARALIGSFEEVEATATAQKAMQVLRAFEADLRQLGISNRDYAQWDVAEDYIRDRNPRFIQQNFSREALLGMHVDVVLIINADGAEIYSCFTDRSSAAIVSPAPREYLRDLDQFLLGDRSAARHPPAAQGIVKTSHGLAAFSALEIRRSDQTRATGSTMLFARFIEGSDIQRIRDTSQLPVQMIPLEAGAASSGSLPARVRAWVASADGSGSTFVLPESEREISGYVLIRGLDRRPIALFRTESARDIFALGYRTTWIMFTGIVVLFIAFGAAVIWLMMRLQRSFAARRSVETRYRNIAAQLRESIVLINAGSLDIVEANEAALRALGCERDMLRSRTVQDIFPQITPAILAAATENKADRTIHASRERRAGGSWVDCEVTITPLDIHGRTLLILVAHDITHRKEAEDRERQNRRALVKIAQHDSLTGLPNRTYLHNKLPLVLEKMVNSERLVAVVYIDIDHFKNINDSRGHGCGDQLLQTVAKRMRAAVPAHDLVARFGGDEFVVIASLINDIASVEALALQLRTAVSAPIALESDTVSVTASLGIAIFPRDGRDIKALLKNADIALYQAKEAGRDCHRFFFADMDLRLSEHVALEQALRHAVGSEQIFMEYQPVIDLRTGRVASFEALMRWQHPERGAIGPSQFIPVAEQSGLIVELGLNALKMVIAQIRAWLDASVPIVPIAVNVSPLQFDRTDFAASVSQLARQSGVDPIWLRFEITESALMREPDKLIGTLQTLRELGSQVLIDDFGTGYSSLSYLDRLPVDTLKIDRAFVGHAGEERGTAIIDVVINLAKRLGLKTVAEGVETAEQAAVLRELGCDYAQGYFYSKPVGARSCLRLLQELEIERPLTQTVLVRAISGG
jgi:diguanylate cyclase (GGDEF)-like protein/PAS domain S-box-containing protein